ncbi:unnamed protein product [Rotaria sp. Silwood1]|nr:unnamed protein product [Rotaria sp. Silwood1]
MPFVANAQIFNYITSKCTYIGTTPYNDLGNNGTKVSSNLHNKPFTTSDNSAVLPIGFKFNFVGDTFTTFVLNTNGVIKFGTDTIEANASKDVLISNHPSAKNIVFLCNTALQSTAVTEYRKDYLDGFNDLWFTQGCYECLFPYYNLSICNAVLPATVGNGLTYRFGCFNMYPINVEKRISYTVGKIPLNYDNSIKATVRNIGKQNLYNHPISLDVKGANSYHKTLYIDTLLAGSYGDITFTGFNINNKGIDTNIVSLGADYDNADNYDTTYQLVNDSLVIGTCLDEYEDDTIRNPNSNQNTTFEIATRFHTNTPQKIVSVSPYFPRSGIKYKIYIYAANADTPQVKLYPTTGTGLTNTSTKYVIMTITNIAPTTAFKNISGCNSVVYKSKVYTASTTVLDTVVMADTNTLYGCSSINYKGNTYNTSTTVIDTLKNTNGCDSFYHNVNINILSAANCGGYLILDVDSIYNNFSDTLKVKVKIKDGVNVFSIFAYLNFDSSNIRLVSSSAGNYLGTQVLNQPPVVTGDRIDFGLTQTFGQLGSTGDGIVYEFGFLLNNIPPTLITNGNASLYFNLSNLKVYNVNAQQPTSFKYLSKLVDTTLCNVNVHINVWPGDLNNDKIVTVGDLLPIGYAYGLSGKARSNASLMWNPQPALLWGADFTNKNSNGYLVYADADGDGNIGLADQAAIGFNLRKSHAKLIKPSIAIAPQNNFPTNIPAINVDMPDTLIPKTSLPLTPTVNITVGSSSYSINNLYGVAFEIYFNPAYVNTAAISTNYISSVFGTQNVNYTKIEDYSEIASGKLSIALTRFNTTSIVANGGKVLSINLPLIATAPAGWFKVTAIPIGCNDILGNSISVTGSEDSLRIGATNLLISGRCITPQNKSIKKVNCNLSGIGILASDLLGGYEFSSGITANTNYILRPTKNNDITKANGVTSVDVLLTQRHILNTTKLNSAYKLIAADVNGDKTINATDVLRIKRLILGTDTTFTKGSGVNKADSLLTITNDITAIEAWDNDYKKHNIVLTQKVINNQLQATNQLAIYPNPTSGLVHILIPSDEKGAWAITVQDVLGKIISTTQTTALTKSLNLQVSNQRGMYFITLANNKTGKRIVEKVVVE